MGLVYVLLSLGTFVVLVLAFVGLTIADPLAGLAALVIAGLVGRWAWRSTRAPSDQPPRR